MDKEVSLADKFTKWKVYRRVGKKVTESIEETSRMTLAQALVHFKASAIMGLK